MKRKMYLMVLLLAVAITGCGGKKNADSVTKVAEEEQITETDTNEEVGEETPVAEDDEATADDAEAEARYHELLAENMEEQMHQYVPRVGEDFSFQVYDEVESTEDVLTCSEGTYVIIHFENSAKDVVAIDSSRVDDSINYFENSDVIEAVLNELHQQSSYDIIDKVPAAGEKVVMYKKFTPAKVIDTEIIYQNNRYYIVDNGYGLKNLVYVDISNVPEESCEAYQYGYFEEGLYLNPISEIKISTTSEGGVYSATGVARPHVMNFNTINKKATEFREPIWGFAWGEITLETFEFSESITEDDCEKMIQELYPGLVVSEEQEIAGKKYKGANWLDESEKEQIREDAMTYYRMQGNKVYVIRVLPSAMDFTNTSIENALEAITAF